MYQRFMPPEEIEKKSFAILQSKMGNFTCPPDQLEIVTRIAHATTDVEWAKTFSFHPEAISAGIKALRSGCNILTDVEMVRVGIRKKGLEDLGCTVHCLLNDEEVIRSAREQKATRSQMAMRKGAELMNGGIVVIGNAPTALFEVIDLIKAGVTSPALVVGIPIGFVGAAESHQELIELDHPYITHEGPKGGSPVAASIMNAMIKLAARDNKQ